MPHTNNLPRSILKVSELNAEVALLLQSGFPLLWVEGEISNLSRPASGHLYFSLKDSKAQIRCAMFKNKNRQLRITPENGIKVLAQAKVGLYEARGDFQLIIENMEDAGAGQLQLAFEALKKKLDTQGLFAASRKKTLPITPNRIGIITSPSGAAIQDVLNVLKRRCPHIPLLIYPVSVQGEQAAGEIVNAIEKADDDQHCDVLLLIRGGGSVEDLWSFNKESVAQAIFSANTPIVSGVGHEIDFTIADFVSDQRAPTPSAAAELISQNRTDLIAKVQTLSHTLNHIMAYSLQTKKDQLNTLQHRLKQQSGLATIQQYKQRIDSYDTQLNRNIRQQLLHSKTRLQHLEQRLLAQSPLQNLQHLSSTIHGLKHRLITAIRRKQAQSTEQLRTLSTHLNTISPLATLQRGYAITRDNDKVIYSTGQLKPGQSLNILLFEGDFDCKVVKVN